MLAPRVYLQAMHCSQAIHPRYICRVHTHPRYCVGSLIVVVHGCQAICPRYCVGFTLALAGVQVWPQTGAVAVLSLCWSE